jgi:putative redox protein
MDVVSILEKMRQKIDRFDMKIEAQKNSHPPIYFKSTLIQYFLKGDIQVEKAIKALDSSLTKYCGVNYMISKAGKIFFELHLNDKLIHQGEVHFQEPLND